MGDMVKGEKVDEDNDFHDSDYCFNWEFEEEVMLQVVELK